LGTAAIIVFLGSLALGFICLVVLVYSALLIYRTGRYAYKDAQPWMVLFKGYLEELKATAGAMEERVQSINRTGQELRENVDDIRDAMEEIGFHPLLLMVELVARLRR
jgi:hypothetical protein